VVVVIVVLASAITGLLLTRERVGTDQPVASPTATPPPTPTPVASARPTPASVLPLADQRQVTFLLTVRDDDRAVVSAVLVGVGGDTGFVAQLVLPPDLLLPTTPPMRLAEADDPTGAQTAEEPLETLLGVQVDAIIDLDRLAWGGLVDAMGGRVDAETAARPEAFVDVLDDVLGGLPYDAQRVGQLLTGLGSMARTTVTNEDASALLALAGRQVRGGSVRRASLPVVTVRSGPRPASVVDPIPADRTVRMLFPEALLEPGHAGPVRVVLQRAGATLGALTAARVDLAAAGFGVIVDPTELELAASTVILVPRASDEARSRGLDVAEELGLPASTVVVDESPTAVVDVRVVLGPDAVVTAP
jgi:hypothetical protein